MYGYLIRPDTLPRSYIKWFVRLFRLFSAEMLILSFRIDTASRLPPETIAINRDLFKTGKFNIADLEAVLETPVSCSSSVYVPNRASDIYAPGFFY